MRINQQVCEKLGIEPVFQYWAVGDESGLCFNGTKEECQNWAASHPYYVQQFGYAVVERVRYPELATEAGFFVLIAALYRNGYDYEIKSNGGSATARVYRNYGYSKKSAETPQQALLKAAAARLGVQE